MIVAGRDWNFERAVFLDIYRRKRKEVRQSLNSVAQLQSRAQKVIKLKDSFGELERRFFERKKRGSGSFKFIQEASDCLNHGRGLANQELNFREFSRMN